MLKKFTAEVVKKDSETVTAQGDATLAGAVYGLYLDGDLVDTYIFIATEPSRVATYFT